MRLIRAVEARAMPWRNGLGVTREIALAPTGAGLDDFDWRLSIADVTSDGEFSLFPGVERTLTVLEGDGLTLVVDGRATVLAPGAPFSFPGEARVTARLAAGPIRDLNIMTRRARVRHEVRALPDGEAAPAGTRILVACEDGVTIAGHKLSRGDALLSQDDATLQGLTGAGPLLAVRIERMEAPRAGLP